jgi:hypothetical protein
MSGRQHTEDEQAPKDSAILIPTAVLTAAPSDEALIQAYAPSSFDRERLRRTQRSTGPLLPQTFLSATAQAGA